MKIDRLIGILTTLQQHKKVTAPYLAEKFEVSRRTIQRDIEDICRAGIPIVSTQGKDGGLSLMEGFALDTTLFTEQELSAIFTGLQSLDSVSRSSNAAALKQKMGGDGQPLSGDMSLDLASFYKEDLARKIEQIRAAIRARRLIDFHYYYDKGEADKRIEPYRVVFKWSDWYVFGYCLNRQDFRLYKLRRLWSLQVREETYEPREIPPEKEQLGSHMTDSYRVAALYQPAVKYRLVEEYGPDSYTELADGRLYTRWGFSSPEKALSWFLGFGDQVQVMDPPEMVERVRQALSAALENYPPDTAPRERRTYSVLLDYLERYGQVTFEEAPLNDVDRLIFAQAAYLNFSQAVPLKGAPLHDVLGVVQFEEADHPTQQRFSFQHRDDRALCSLLSHSRRYRPLYFAGFECTTELQTDGQFAVLSLLLPDGTLLIAFRGTDNTLAGWKEDFDLCFRAEVPAQRRARLYAAEQAASHPFIELCGHSKGGNLALYAAACCPKDAQQKIRSAVSFDGPGLSRELIQSEGYARVQERMRLLVPRSSLVGRLFYQPQQVRVVECSVLSLLQHYPYTWKTQGMDFVDAESPSPSSQKISRTLCGLLERLPLDTREQFVEAVYEIVCATGAQTLNELARGWLRNTPAVVRKLRSMDRETYRLLLPVLRAFWLSLGETMGLPLPEEERPS